MKKLICEMCGGTDLVKQNGLFVCQHCGAKYSVEEARKIMVEGTIKIDESDKIDNYYEMAENAYQSNNRLEAENYCNKIIEIDASHYKAWFLKGKSAGWLSSLYHVRIEEAINCFSKAIDNAPENELSAVKKEVSAEAFSLLTELMRLCCENFAADPSDDNKNTTLKYLHFAKTDALSLFQKCGAVMTGFNSHVAAMMNTAVCHAWQNVITKEYQKAAYPSEYEWKLFVVRCCACIDILTESVQLSDTDQQADIQRYKNLIDITIALIDSCSYKKMNNANVKDLELPMEAKQLQIDKLMSYHEKIKALDPSYKIPKRPKAKSGGCYIATAVYGSYDCPQVWTLRRFRDGFLAKTWCGRAFIRIYYAISPSLVKRFGKTEWFRLMWKRKLDRMVSNLNAKGVDDTPYQDPLY